MHRRAYYAYCLEHMGLADGPKYPERANPHRKDVYPGQRMRRCYIRHRAMMHSIDEDGIFLKVNPRWLSAMGDPADEVIGHQFTDFLTEECRIQALSDGLPLFWEAGRVHGASYRLT